MDPSLGNVKIHSGGMMHARLGAIQLLRTIADLAGVLFYSHYAMEYFFCLLTYFYFLKNRWAVRPAGLALANQGHVLRQFAGLSLERIPDETTILNFRRLLEKHELAVGILAVINGYLGDRGLSLRQGTIVDTTLIHAPSSTKNQHGKRDPEMHQTKKGNTYYFGMKAHIGVDAESGLVHSVVGMAANVADVTQVDRLLYGEENVVCADAGYTGVEKREEHAGRQVIWQVAARCSTYQKHGKRSLLYRVKRRIEKAKAQVRAKVEHPFRVIKRQFGYVKVRFRGLAKNTTQLVTLFALSNLWMARRHLLTNAGEVRL